MADPREKELAAIRRKIDAARQLEERRDQLLCELVAEQGHGAMTRLAKIAGISRPRISQIVKPQKLLSREIRAKR